MLIASRIVILTVFFLVAFFLGTITPAIYVSTAVLYSIYTVIVVMFLMSLVYTLLLRNAKHFLLNIYFQIIVDIVLITFLVYVTGSMGSNYSLLYSMVIIYSSIFLGRRGALIFASVSGVAYGLIIDFEYFKIIPTVYSTGRDYTVDAGDALIRFAVHILSFYVLAFLASFVVEQEKKTRTLLEERESAFNQLDLLFRSIIESVDTGVMTTTFHGRIKTFNRAAEKITGFSLKSVENRQIQDIFPDFFIFFGIDDQNMVRRREVNVANGRGEKVILGCSVSPLKDRHEKQIGYIVIFQDLTEIKRMEEKLEKGKKLALIGEMAAGLAHEMRNPLASITGSIQLLGQNAKLDETDRRLMQIIMRGKEQLDLFVRDFLLLSRPVPENREPVVVSDIVEEVLEHIRMTKEWNNDIQVSQSSSGSGVNAYANKEQVRQIVQNIIQNALQAIEGPGNIKIEISHVTLEDQKDYVVFKVTDDGSGIEEKDLKNVFEPFFTNKEKGTGLGLAIVSRLVDGYGGKIKLESKVNQGTTVTVWLSCD